MRGCRRSERRPSREELRLVVLLLLLLLKFYFRGFLSSSWWWNEPCARSFRVLSPKSQSSCLIFHENLLKIFNQNFLSSSFGRRSGEVRANERTVLLLLLQFSCWFKLHMRGQQTRALRKEERREATKLMMPGDQDKVHVCSLPAMIAAGI